MTSHDYVQVDYDEIVRETDKAICVRIDNDDFWLPWSQIEDNGELDKLRGQLFVRRWICDENEVPYV